MIIYTGGSRCLSARSEFYTAYTPYQPVFSRVAAGIYEYQSFICELTVWMFPMLLYMTEGPALFEAMMMRCAIPGEIK